MLDPWLGGGVFAFFLLFARVGALFAFLPGFSSAYVPPRVRLVLALAVTLVLTPVLAAGAPSQPPTPVGLALLTLGEAAIGVFLGVMARVALAAMHVAGTFAAYFSSLASALVQDPITDQQTATIAGFLSTLGLVLIFLTGLDHLMLAAVRESYRLFPIGQPPPLADLSSLLTREIGHSFAIGLQLSAPFLVMGLVYNVGLGLLSRLMPQLPVFFFGLPIQIGLQIWLLMLSISGIVLVFLDYFSQAVGALAGS